MAEQRAFVSIHDVMPDTLDRVAGILERLERHRLHPVTLLVVPGLEWRRDQVDRLRAWADAGHDLAAHGWMHHVDAISGIQHRLHATFISRDVAEHMALKSSQIVDLVERSVGWFPGQQLPSPRLYVPPAWAVGPLNRADRRTLACDFLEVTNGFWHIPENRFAGVPMIGYEADTPFRRRAVGIWNRVQRSMATAANRPLRLSIHPNDFDLLLAADLEHLIQSPLTCLSVSDIGGLFPGR